MVTLCLAAEEVDHSGGLAGDLSVRIERGETYKLLNESTNTVTIASVRTAGAAAIKDNQNVCVAAGDRTALLSMVAARCQAAWKDLDDLLTRCSLPKDARRALAKAGAFNALGHHRRSALWRSEAEVHHDLFFGVETNEGGSPLAIMKPEERLEADYQTTRMTVGPHPMLLVRAAIPQAIKAINLPFMRHGQGVTLIGMVICRQRPGTAKGHCFISLEDETGISNAFVPSALFEAKRLIITQEPFLEIRGMLQHSEGVITFLAGTVLPFRYPAISSQVQSHDFR